SVRVLVRTNRHRASTRGLLGGHRRDQVRRNALSVPRRLMGEEALVGDRELRARVVWILRIALLYGQGDRGPVPVVDLYSQTGKLRKIAVDGGGIPVGLDDLLARGEDADGIAIGTHGTGGKGIRHGDGRSGVSVRRGREPEDYDEDDRPSAEVPDGALLSRT